MKTRMEGKNLYLETTLGEAIEFYYNPEFTIARNKTSDALSGNSDSFCGGSKADLKNSPDMTQRKKALEKLKSGRIFKNLTQKSGETRQRRRGFSEYDGDWELGRQWEIKPFAHATRVMSYGTVIDLFCHFACGARVSAGEIDRYGALVWAIVTQMESRGLKTRVWCLMESDHCDSTRNKNGNVRILVKKPGEYLAPTALARTFSSNFFRRVGFHLQVKQCDANGLEVCHSLGGVRSMPKSVWVQDGALHLSPDCMTGLSEGDEDTIIKLIGGDGV